MDGDFAHRAVGESKLHDAGMLAVELLPGRLRGGWVRGKSPCRRQRSGPHPTEGDFAAVKPCILIERVAARAFPEQQGVGRAVQNTGEAILRAIRENSLV